MVRKELLVILPAHNEAKNLPALLDRMEAQGVAQMADVLVINDASEDETGQIIAARGYACITNVFNLGYGGAIQVGYKYAVQHGYRYLIQMDADGQHDPVNLPVIYERLRGYPAGGGVSGYCIGHPVLEGRRFDLTFSGQAPCPQDVLRIDPADDGAGAHRPHLGPARSEPRGVFAVCAV